MNSPLRESLVAVLGKDAVRDDPQVLAKFSHDRTENPAGRPDAVVSARSAEDVRQVLVLANRERVPVVPVVANTNLGGLAIPARGGIVLDLSGMNSILEVNEADQFAVIEPGVTWEQLHEHLAAHHPDLRFGYPLSPPDSGVMPNFLLDGLLNLSLRHGSAAHWINALEVILPTGDTLRTGHLALGSRPCTNAALPGLEGLFVGFQGTTGVVVKMAIQLWPNRRLRRRMFLLAHDVSATFGWVNRLVREELLDDLGVLSLPTGKMLFGEKRPIFRDPAEPDAFIYLDFSSNFERDFEAKQAILGELIEGARRGGLRLEGPLDVRDLVRIEPRFEKFARFPTRLDFLLDHPGEGLTWIGTYGPVSRFAEGFLKGSEIMVRHGFPPVIVSRQMRGGHFGVLRWITVFDRRDEAECERVRALNLELADQAVELGFFPYKTPQWVWERYAERIDPTFCRLVRDLKRLVDPNGIMNPGHLELGLPDLPAKPGRQ